MYKNILFPVDLDEESSWKIALPVALEHVKAFGSKLHVMTVVPNFGMSVVSQYFPRGSEDKILEGAKEALHQFTDANIPSDVSVQRIISQGTVYETIIDTARRIDADLIIMAAHRPELKDYLLGPNAARVVRHSDRSVLVVRSS